MGDWHARVDLKGYVCFGHNFSTKSRLLLSRSHRREQNKLQDVKIKQCFIYSVGKCTQIRSQELRKAVTWRGQSKSAIDLINTNSQKHKYQ